ncbi:protein FAM221B isoform X2 [Kogia breviceps]|uniref:protein FAM221B isoform X2 n=1 Tax=Kogia breviceps TaxID=27615 RepID=UPI0034D32749
MEADKVTEEPHTTMDAEESLSSKDPSAEDSQEPPIPEIPLEPAFSETPLEPLASESPMVPSISQIPLETHTSETPLEPSISEVPLEHSASEVPLETPTPETQLETHISNVPEKHLTFQTSSLSCVSESSSSEGSWTRRSIQTSESQSVPKHSLSGLPAQVHLDTSAKDGEEEEEGEKGVDTIDSTIHAAQPEHQLGKKKGKKGVSRYTVHPVVPAEQADLVEVTKAMHKGKFGAQVNYLFQWEKEAALNAIQTGLYIGRRCRHYLWDCFRIGDDSKCFCGHLLRQHQIISDISVPCNVGQCRCLMFCFIPSHPEKEQIMCLSRRCLPSEKPSSTTLTSRPSRRRGPLAVPAPTLVPLGSLAHAVSSLAPYLTPVPNPFTSALPSSRDRHCQHLVQGSVSLAQISNKGKATGIWLALYEADRARPGVDTLGPWSWHLQGVRESTRQERGWIQPSASTAPTFKLLALASGGESGFKEAKEGGDFKKEQ